ncbi:MAG: hypothetical protein AB1758_04495 [Candidatus Eremiobacterota bacterium]
MPDYLRVLSRYSHWPRPDRPEWGEPALEDLVEEEVSVYRVDSERALEAVVVGFSAGRRNPQHLDFVLLPESLLLEVGGILAHTPQNCSLPVAAVRELHFDLTGVSPEAARQVLERLSPEFGRLARRSRRRDIVQLAIRARQQGWPEVTAQEWGQVPAWLLE